MPNRVAVLSVLALVVPSIAVLLIVLVIARPAPSSPAAPETRDPASAGPQAASNSVTGGAAQDAPARPAPTTAPARPRPAGVVAPDFAGGGAWINSPPLKLADLKGKIVLVDFWAYGCYNCTNTLPYIKQWWDTYKDQGLVIVGVHTPEFESEKVLANLQRAVESSAIGWPVVQDNDRQIWRAYDNHYWPHFYLIDDRGRIVYDHIGEGAYDETERQIAAALAAAKAE